MYETSETLDWDWRSDLKGRRSSRLDPLDFFMWSYVKNYPILVRIQSLSHTNARIEVAIADLTTETLEKVWKIITPRINHVIWVNGEHIEHHNT